MHLHLLLIFFGLRVKLLMSHAHAVPCIALQTPCLEMLFAWPLVLLCVGKEQ